MICIHYFSYNNNVTNHRHSCDGVDKVLDFSRVAPTYTQHCVTNHMTIEQKISKTLIQFLPNRKPKQRNVLKSTEDTLQLSSKILIS